MKVFLIIILILIIVCAALIIIIKNLYFKNKNLKNQITDYKAEYFELNNRFKKLMEENEIEKKYKKELAKRLADISRMSIDDVLAQLQDNDSHRKDNL